MNFSNYDGQSSTPENPFSKSIRANATRHLRKYFDGLMDLRLAEYYEVPIPTVLFSEESQTLEVVEGAEAIEDALMKLWFVADTRAQAQRNDYQSAGSSAGYEVIRNSHKRLHKPKMPRIFTVISANEYDSPYEKMRTLRRTPDNKEVVGGYGIHYAAEVLVGNVVLGEPEFSASHPDPEIQELVKRAFLGLMG